MRQSGTVTAKEGLSSREVTTSHETAIAAVTEKARAEIESAYIMAKKFPRNEEDARINIIRTCRIPSFAEKAKYKKPIGKSAIIGPSIRLAEEIARQWGNIDVEMTVLYEDPSRRLVQIRVIDLQTGSTGRAQFVIEKTVERKNAYGRNVVAERLNSSGEKISIVEATEDEVLSKQNATASKYRRNLILQLIPTYILADAIEQVDETIRSGVKTDPERAKKAVADNYAKLGIKPSDIEKYLGHSFAQLTPDEIVNLKDLYTAMAEGETTWAQILASKEEQPGETAQPDTKEVSDEEIAKIWQGDDVQPGDPSTHTGPGDKQDIPGKK